MGWKRKIFGVLLALAGAVPPYVLYALSEDGNLRNPPLMIGMLVAAVVSFLNFAVCRNALPTRNMQLAVGVIGSYLSFLLLVIVIAATNGQVSETIMWLPIVILFGIPFMAPLVGMSWLASSLVFEPASKQSFAT